MALITHNITLDITPGLIPPVVYVSEYDVGRDFVITLQNRGQAFMIPSGTTAKVEGTIAGHPFSEDATPSGNTVTFALKESMTAFAGRAWTKIKLTQNNKPVSTCGFWLDVDRHGVEAGDVIGAPGFKEQIQEAVDDWLDEHGGITVDDTLSQQGEAADAKAVGDALTEIIGEGSQPSEVVDVSSDFVYLTGKSILADGSETSNSYGKIVDYFPVVSGKTYKFIFTSNSGQLSNTRIHGYDTSWQWVSQLAVVESSEARDYMTFVSVPSGVKYLRISINYQFTIKEFSYTSGGGSSDEYDNLTNLTSRVEALEDSQVVIETDDTLSVEGAAADAKATGDAIEAAKYEILAQIGEDEPVTVLPSGSLDALVNSTGLLATSSATKAFYAPCEPNTNYAFNIVPAGAIADTNAHFFAEFTDITLSIGTSQSANFQYSQQSKPSDSIVLRTSANAKWIVWGHGTFKNDTLFEIVNLDQRSATLLELNAEALGWELGGISSVDGSEIVNNARLRMVEGVKVSNGCTVSVGQREYLWGLYGDKECTAKIAVASAFVTGETIVNQSGYLRIAIKNSTDISDSDIPEIVADVVIKVSKKDVQSAMMDDYIEYGWVSSSESSKHIRIGDPYVYLSEPIEDEILDSKTCDDVYAIYDGLCTDHPETFVRLPDIGAETSQNLPLRMYRMKWTTPFVTETEASWSQSNNIYQSDYDGFKRLFVSAGTHGNEKSSAYGVALAIKEIVESDSEFAKYIRGNFALDIVPIVNPAGFNATTRNNGSNVNINRDFLTRNTAEAQAVYNVLTSNEYYACIDSHNSGGNANYIGIPNTNPRYKEYIKIGMKFGQIMFNDWKALATGEQYATSPYTQFWLHTPGAGMMQDLFTELGLVGWLIESVGVFASSNGTLTPNHKKYCKFTKDLLINSIICLGTNEWN